MANKEKIVEKIIERCSTIFGKQGPELSEATRFTEDLKAKSGNITQITTFLEDAFDVEVPYMEFRRNKTIGEAADYVADLLEG